jgi:hypothetical protein
VPPNLHGALRQAAGASGGQRPSPARAVMQSHRRVVLFSPCWNGVKRRCSISGAMPMPLSWTENSTHTRLDEGDANRLAALARDTTRAIVPCSVNLTA